ncbi:polysaccharide pyruvyl transferase family protein [Terrisporobacter sp.]
MKKCFLYAHGGSKNHGCEAIVRGTNKVLNQDNLTVYSLNPSEDNLYNLNNIVNIKKQTVEYSKLNPKRILASLKIRLFNDDTYAEKIQYDSLFKNHGNDDLAISVGGDNYCYSGYKTYEILNKEFNKKGTKTVLWGCSVEPDLIDENMAADLSNYSLIAARESITYQAVKKVNKNTKLIPDPAFQLDKIDLPLPIGFTKNNTIGINISPHIMTCESRKGATINNYEALIHHIIKTTNMQIALIPHVVWKNNDDRKPLEILYDKFKDTNRVIILRDYNCMELKGFISRCRIFIGARTHSTIAAYSTCVPTLVIGYSVKAKGIAKDIFGTYENYVLPVQSLSNKDDLINAFEWVKEHEYEIRTHLNNFMPEYKKRVLQGRIEIEKLLGE